MISQRKQWKLFSVFGHEVRLEPFFLLLVAFFVFTDLNSLQQLPQQLLWAPILFASILWHEIGHAVAIKKFGYGRSVIILQGLGGVTVNQRRALKPGKEILISAAGPLFSFSLTVVFGIAAYFYPSGDLLHYFFMMMAIANLVWTIFNLLPVAPLDGGQIVLYSLVLMLKDRGKALWFSAVSSLAILALGALAALTFAPRAGLLVVLIAFLLAVHNIQIVRRFRQGSRA